MECKNCHHELVEGIYVCPNCGEINENPEINGGESTEIQQSTLNPTVQTITKSKHQTDPTRITKKIIKVFVIIAAVCCVLLLVLNIGNILDAITNAVTSSTTDSSDSSDSSSSGTSTDSSAGTSSDTDSSSGSSSSDTDSDSDSDSGSSSGTSTDSSSSDSVQAAASSILSSIQDENDPEYIAYSCDAFVAFLSGRFYIDCEWTESDAVTAIEMAFDGDDYQMNYESDGMTLGIACVDDDFYLIDIEHSTYTKLSSTILSMLGMSSDELEFDVTWPTMDMDCTFVSSTLNSEDCVVASFSDSSGGGNFNVYIVDGEVILFETTDSSGNVTMSMDINELTGDLPTGYLDLDSLEKVGMISFFTTMMDV